MCILCFPVQMMAPSCCVTWLGCAVGAASPASSTAWAAQVGRDTSYGQLLMKYQDGLFVWGGGVLDGGGVSLPAHLRIFGEVGGE